MPEQVQDIPLSIVGGSKFGRYPKISVEQTWNMLVSDTALVDYAGYKAVAQIAPNATGRGIHTSTVGGFMIIVVGSQVLRVGTDLNPVPIPGGNLATNQGDVFIAENNASQIALSDGVHIYIYNYFDNTFQIATTVYASIPEFKPGIITFQNTRFLTVALGTRYWVLSAGNNGLSWPDDDAHIGTLETKPDTCQAAIPFPGRGNQMFLFGNTVSESWTDQGLAVLPYQKNTSFNVDYGCLNAASIAYQSEFVVWLGASEEAGPVLMYSTGGDFYEISTDGIDYQFSTLKTPQDCTGFLLKLDGHLLYQFTFKTDNVSYIYDFTTKLFFNVSDENLNYHIARKAVFFNNDYYFVSYNDGNLYQFGTQYSSYQYSDTNIQQIPRIRITPPLRLPSQDWYISRDLSFAVENGQLNTYEINDDIIEYDMAIDLSVSRDGGESFGTSMRYDMNPTGHRQSKIIFRRLGIANDSSYQIRFNGYSRYVAFDGVIRAYTQGQDA